ncbi:ROK family transcriptional regulator [Arsenicitalea aurantiaca]|uniref:ROK family transcriptional regulator n=1 Tax=Arsenicitalea aurantiaca TaxID=1783274 RepID=A0A433XBC3_9HYPH|nr:ROK family transcriptional regulator [Arsenicitalea aurantiaca]RUT31375.1 ROK family transcriptional regulator [Arsenicitalea aurantiaca]
MATPQSVRHLNEIRALNVLFRTEGMSRADLARALGLNRSTTGNIIANLRADALVIERPDMARPDGETRTGRPGIHIEIDALGAYFIGAEIGVDRLTVLAIDLAAREVARRSIDFSTALETPEAGIARIAGMIGEIIAMLPDPGLIRGLCVALPALLDPEGVVVNGLILGWQDVRLRDGLAERLPVELPIHIENDANAFAIAETYRDAAHQSETVAFMLIENGAGGGIVIGGRLFRGNFGLAGEFGQIAIGGEGFFRGRHKMGHLESYIGKDAIVARYRANGGPQDAGLEQLLEALARRDKIALLTARDWGSRLALGLVQVASVLNPGQIILGGSVAPVFAAVAEEVEAAMRAEFIEGFPMPRILVSSLGQEGPALGAALLLHQRMLSVDESLIYPGAAPETLFNG